MTGVNTYKPPGSNHALLFETEHYEVLSTLIKLFAFNNSRITCIVSKPVQQKLAEIFGSHQTIYTEVVIPAAINRFKIFWLLQKTIAVAKPGLFFLSTVSSNHLLFALLLNRNKTVRNILTVHDINCLFADKPQPGIKNFIRFIGKKKLVKAVHEFNVIADTMLPALQNKVNNAKPVHLIPGAVYSSSAVTIPLQNNIKLAVPGTVDDRRRNYNEVIELVLMAEENKLPLEISLAGAYNNDYGYGIIEQVKKLDLKFCTVHYFKPEGLSQHNFDECLANAHFIYMPCVVETSICAGIKETYGVTKSSGNISDVIQFAKPFISPAALKIPTVLEGNCYKYSNTSEIFVFLSGLLQNSAVYLQLCNNALNNVQCFTVEAVSTANPAVFNKSMP